MFGGVLVSPEASAYTAVEGALGVSTALGGVAGILGRSGVRAATQAGTRGLTQFTLTHGAHKAEKVVLGAEVTFHFFVPEPHSEMG